MAIEGIEVGEAADPDVFRNYESKAETVKLADSAKEVRKRKVVPAAR